MRIGSIVAHTERLVRGTHVSGTSREFSKQRGAGCRCCGGVLQRGAPATGAARRRLPARRRYLRRLWPIVAPGRQQGAPATRTRWRTPVRLAGTEARRPGLRVSHSGLPPLTLPGTGSWATVTSFQVG